MRSIALQRLLCILLLNTMLLIILIVVILSLILVILRLIAFCARCWVVGLPGTARTLCGRCAALSVILLEHAAATVAAQP